MSAGRRLSARDVEAILQGAVSSDDPELGHLVRFLEDTTSALAERPSDAVQRRHLEAMSVTSRAGERVFVRQRRGLAQILRTTSIRVAAIGGALALMTGGALAAAGQLPDFAQNVVADAVRFTGVNLPGGQDMPKGTTSVVVSDGVVEGETKQAENRSTDVQEGTTTSSGDPASGTAHDDWMDCADELSETTPSPSDGDVTEACGPEPDDGDDPGEPTASPPVKQKPQAPAMPPSEGGTG